MSCITKARRANTCLTLLLLAQFSIFAQDTARTNPPSQQNNPFGRAEVPDSEEARRFIRAHSFDNPLFSGQQAGIAQSLEQTAKQVRMIYLVPSNKSARADYQDAIANAISNLRLFYSDQIGGGYAFTLHSPIVEVYQTPHTAEFYSTGDNARPGGLWEGVLADGFALTGGGFNDPNNRWIFYVDVDPICGQYSGGTSGVALLPANDLRGLTNQATVPTCPGDPSTLLSVNRWIGGLGHELGHAFNLPHPPGCDSGACTGGLYAYNSLMYVGYSIYPNTYLLDEDKTQLLATGFFSVQPAIQLLLDQSGPALDQVAALDSVLFLRDPFSVLNSANVLNPGADRNTRVIIFLTNLQLAQDETSSAVIVNLVDSNNQNYDVAAEDVRFLTSIGVTQVTFRLPNALAVGTCTIKVKAHSQVSNAGTVRIRT